MNISLHSRSYIPEVKLLAIRQPVQFEPQYTVCETASNTNNTKDWNQQTMSRVGNTPWTMVLCIQSSAQQIDSINWWRPVVHWWNGVNIKSDYHDTNHNTGTVIQNPWRTISYYPTLIFYCYKYDYRNNRAKTWPEKICLQQILEVTLSKWMFFFCLPEW